MIHRSEQLVIAKINIYKNKEFLHIYRLYIYIKKIDLERERAISLNYHSIMRVRD